MTEQESAAAGFGCLLDTFEAMVHFLATVAVSAYFRGGPAGDESDRLLLERLGKEGWSVGDLWGLLRDTVRHAPDLAQRLPWPEMARYLFTPSGKLTRSGCVLESFVSLGNRVWGHGAGREEGFFAELLPPNRARLEEELARAGWLASWDLVRPVRIEADRVTQADLLRGERRLKNRPYDLHLEQADLDDQPGDVRAERSLLLVDPTRERYLPLFPLALFHFHLRSQGVFFLQRPQWKREAGRRKLRKAGYIAYEAGLGEHEEAPGDPAARSLEQHVQRLEERLLGRLAPTNEGPGQEEDPDCDLPEVRQELEFHRRTFAGRDDVMRRVEGWLHAGAGGGYLVLLGPPGQGKSALLAEVSRRAGDGCVVHFVKSHRSPLRFLPSLIRQASKRANVPFGADAYRGDTDDLRNSLVKALEAVRDKCGRAVLVLDALDELDSRHERLGFLPEVLPAGVRAVLSCRPDIPLVQALRARLRGLEEWPLRPLSQDDLWPLLRKRVGAELPDEDVDRATARITAALDWPALFDRLQGNPLFLQRALDQVVVALRAAPLGGPLRIGLHAFPATLEALFQSIYNEVAEKEGTLYRRPEGRAKARLLHLLCLAREPLGFDALGALLAAGGQPLSLEDCRDRVWEMSPYLLEPAGQRFKPWHQGLADHVRANVLGPEGSRQAETLFASWLRQPAFARSLYALRHRVRHLLGAGLAEEAAELLTQREFVEARAEEEPLYDLVNDYADVSKALPGGHPRELLLRLIEEALRTDLHFLARHPGALFQCLWNRGWWYDCPEAARHYLPPEGEPPPWERSRPKLHLLLQEWRPQKEKGDPGFRWVRSLRPPEIHLGTAQRMVFRGHEAGVAAVVVLAGQERLASASEDRTIRLWDRLGGEELLCIRSHEKRVTALAASPDGRWLVSASDDRTLRLHDAHDGRELLVLTGHRGPVNCVAFSADGQLLISGGDDRSVRLWEAATGRRLACLRGHHRWVAGVAFSPDGKLAASASGDGSVVLWDASERREVGRLTGHTGPVNAVLFSPDGATLATAGDDSTARLWDMASLHERACLRGHFRTVRCLCFAQGGRWLISGGDDRIVRVWDLRSRQVRASLRGHEVTVRGVAALATGELVSAAGDATVRLWDPAGGGELLRRRGHTSWVTSVCFSPDGEWIASGSGDKSVQLTTVSGDQWRVMTGHEDRVWSVCFSPDSRRVASGSRDRTVRVWEVATGSELLCCRGAGEAVRGVCFSPDGARLAAGSKDQRVHLWDARTGEHLRASDEKGSCVVSVCFSPDGRRLAAGCLSGLVVIQDAETGECLARLEGGEDVDGLAFSCDGRFLVSQSLRWTVRVWDVERRECVRVIGGTADAAAVAAGGPRYPWWAVGHRWETSIEPARGGPPLGWLAGTLHRLSTHPQGRTWAATHAHHVEVFTLEGE
jgi:WD40 repeat protein